MKVLVVALFILLCTMTLCSQDKNYTPPTCCHSYSSRKIPRNFVIAYHKTSSMCSTAGIIFHTKRGRQICANPSDVWVQDYIRDLEAILE